MINSYSRSMNFSRTIAVHVSSNRYHGYPFNLYFLCPAAAMIPYGTLFAQPDLAPAESMLIVDSGFSFTHIVPILSGKVIWNAVKR